MDSVVLEVHATQSWHTSKNLLVHFQQFLSAVKLVVRPAVFSHASQHDHRRAAYLMAAFKVVRSVRHLSSSVIDFQCS